MNLDGFMIVYNEEHLLPYALESWLSLLPAGLQTLSIVDNGSTDATLEIIQAWKDRLPIVLQLEENTRSHGYLRNLALSQCRRDWIYYIDGDETFTSDMAAWLAGPQPETANQWAFFKYTTILDRNHYVEGGNGYTQRLFRNFPGVNFPQEIHTEPQHPMLGHVANAHGGPLMFDHTACKWPEELWAKGWRYQWAARAGVPAIGPIHEYVGRVNDAMNHREEVIKEFGEEDRRRIFTGP